MLTIGPEVKEWLTVWAIWSFSSLSMSGIQISTWPSFFNAAWLWCKYRNQISCTCSCEWNLAKWWNWSHSNYLCLWAFLWTSSLEGSAHWDKLHSFWNSAWNAGKFLPCKVEVRHHMGSSSSMRLSCSSFDSMGSLLGTMTGFLFS